MAANAGLELSGVLSGLLIALELKQELWGLALIALGFLLLARAVIINVDWTLLLVFMAMFIDVHLLIQLPVLQHALNGVGQLSAERIVADLDWFVAVYQ